MILFAFKLAFENNVEMPGLKKYVEAILNSWSNQGIKTMESAEKAQEAFKNKKKQNYLPKRQNNVRREKLPDWVNKPQEEKALDPDKKAELEARFAAYQAKKIISAPQALIIGPNAPCKSPVGAFPQFFWMNSYTPISSSLFVLFCFVLFI